MAREDGAALRLKGRSGRGPFHAAGEMLDSERVAGFLVLSHLLLVLFPALVVALFLLGRVPVLWGCGPLFALAGVLALARSRLRHASRGERRFAAGFLLSSLLLIGAVSATFADISTDGATYHTEAVLGLQHGINPLTTLFPGPMELWTNHYPKLTWYFAADVAKSTGAFPLGKSYTLLLAVACWVYAWGWFRRFGITRSAATLLATATAANPVVMSQLVSMYLDGAVASLVTMAVLACAGLVFGRRRLDVAVLAMVAAMLVSVKFTGVAYLGVLLLFTGLTMLLRGIGTWKERLGSLEPVWVAAGAAAVLGVAILGFNPYFTNVQQGHHPMYPLAGAGKIDIMAHHVSPAIFADARRNRVQNLLVSLGSRSQPGLEAPIWKVPFTTSPSEIRSYAGPDVHLAGWGVFFSGVLLLSVLMWVWGRCWKSSPSQPSPPQPSSLQPSPQSSSLQVSLAPANFAAAAVLFTVLVNPYAWWARFAPQLALLPVFLLLPWMIDSDGQRSRWPRRLAVLLCGLLVLDGAINAGCALLASAVPTIRMHRTLAQVARDCGPGQYLAYWVPGDMPYHYEPFSGYRGVAIQSAGHGVAIPAGVTSYDFGVSWGRAKLVPIGGCTVRNPVREQVQAGTGSTRWKP